MMALYVSYKKSKRRRLLSGEDTELIIHGHQCKLTRGYPRHEVDPRISQGWFLRGGKTVCTPDREGWTFPSVEDIQSELLGFGLGPLHPIEWGSISIPGPEDGFD
jgi:hypothetical protein